MDNVIVENRGRDQKTFRTVWRTDDGSPPTVPDGLTGAARTKAEAAAAATESYTLRLGSVDDDNPKAKAFNLDPQTPEEARIRMPRVEVPRWAFELYQRVPLFRHYIATDQIKVAA